jgi:hypothetical protein
MQLLAPLPRNRPSTHRYCILPLLSSSDCLTARLYRSLRIGNGPHPH